MLSELFAIELLESAVHFTFKNFIGGALDPCVDHRVLKDRDFQLSRRFTSGTRTFAAA